MVLLGSERGGEYWKFTVMWNKSVFRLSGLVCSASMVGSQARHCNHISLDWYTKGKPILFVRKC